MIHSIYRFPQKFDRDLNYWALNYLPKFWTNLNKSPNLRISRINSWKNRIKPLTQFELFLQFFHWQRFIGTRIGVKLIKVKNTFFNFVSSIHAIVSWLVNDNLDLTCKWDYSFVELGWWVGDGDERYHDEIWIGFGLVWERFLHDSVDFATALWLTILD